LEAALALDRARTSENREDTKIYHTDARVDCRCQMENPSIEAKSEMNEEEKETAARTRVLAWSVAPSFCHQNDGQEATKIQCV